MTKVKARHIHTWQIDSEIIFSMRGKKRRIFAYCECGKTIGSYVIVKLLNFIAELNLLWLPD